MITSFEDLEVFQELLRKGVQAASKSICANVAEGYAKQHHSKSEFSYLVMAIGSSDEMRVWVRYCLDLEY
jgi:four helix bundle protein